MPGGGKSMEDGNGFNLSFISLIMKLTYHPLQVSADPSGRNRFQNSRRREWVQKRRTTKASEITSCKGLSLRIIESKYITNQYIIEMAERVYHFQNDIIPFDHLMLYVIQYRNRTRKKDL